MALAVRQPPVRGRCARCGAFEAQVSATPVPRGVSSEVVKMFERRRFLTSAMAAGAACLLRQNGLAASRRRDGGPVIDAHAHFFPEAWIKLIESEGGATGARIARTGDGFTFTLEGWRSVRILHPAVDVAERLRIMNQQGVDIQALALTAPMVNWAPPDLAVKLSRVYNDSTSAVCRQHPTRFVGSVSLPLVAPERALEELNRAVKLPGIRAASMPTGIRGKELDDPSFFPIYARCEQLGLPVLLHPVETLGRERTIKFYLENLLGNPYDTGLAAARLIFGGVLDTFPRLEVVLPHGGGTLPGLVGRLNRGVEQREELKHMKKPASAYLRRFTYDTIVHDDAILMNLIRMVGVDRVVLGSDYPFDMGYDKPVEVVERLTSLPPADRDRILGGNAAKLFRIGA